MNFDITDRIKVDFSKKEAVSHNERKSSYKNIEARKNSFQEAMKKHKGKERDPEANSVTIFDLEKNFSEDKEEKASSIIDSTRCHLQACSTSEELKSINDGEVKKNELLQGVLATTTHSLNEAAFSSSSSLKTALSTEALLLMEKVASVCVIMENKGSSETTFFLEQDLFKNSALFGTKITISEFSTAPKIFNVTISTSDQGRNLILPHLSELALFFEAKKWSFSINRVDIDLLSSEQSTVLGKAAVGKEDMGDEGGNEKS